MEVQVVNFQRGECRHRLLPAIPPFSPENVPSSGIQLQALWSFKFNISYQ